MKNYSPARQSLAVAASWSTAAFADATKATPIACQQPSKAMAGASLDGLRNAVRNLVPRQIVTSLESWAHR